MKFDVLWFEVAQLAPSETGVDKKSNDEVHVTAKQMVKGWHGLEETLDLVWIEAARDSILRL